MDMFGGNPPHFYIEGMQGTSRHDEHRDDLWNYFYRSVLIFGLAAKAFGDSQLLDQVSAFVLEFEKDNGKNYTPTK
jgi:hypothetical protein